MKLLNIRDEIVSAQELFGYTINFKTSISVKPVPKIDLHRSPLITVWAYKKMACGMKNTGNTCFIASTIQCLQHIPSWINFLTLQHRQNCREEDGECFVCALMQYVFAMFAPYRPLAISPQQISMNIERIGKNFELGRQEDAHEFLVCLFEKIQKNLTAKLGKLDPASEMTTPLGKIFGGYLKTKSVCYNCFETWDTYEQFLNISLNITNVSTLEEALNNFIGREYSDSHCERCNKKQRTEKRYYIDSLPDVFILHLKRYSCENMIPIKLDKHIQFNERINMKPYLSQNLTDQDSDYLLRGITVHSGLTLSSGHYYSYISDPSDNSCYRQWFCMNDETVRKTNWLEVAAKEAYILYYVRKSTAYHVQKVES